MNQHDSLWKIIIEDIFEDFLAFFLPDVHAAVDFSRGYEFLDKEMVFNQSELSIHCV
ncbi:hypothetical protein SCACP_31970 [Sporomusa carbonis]|uniref:hypothetical protein n=1 Tax=Sporomusa carbonis TaxID=3076075 RepID=UPI003A655A61